MRPERKAPLRTVAAYGRAAPPALALACFLSLAVTPAYGQLQRIPKKPPRTLQRIYVGSAGVVAEKFFEDIRDNNYNKAYTELDESLQKKTPFNQALEVFHNYGRYLGRSEVVTSFTYQTGSNPTQAVACVEAKTGSQRKLYLLARLVQRGSTSADWRVTQFQAASLPETGCPT